MEVEVEVEVFVVEVDVETLKIEKLSILSPVDESKTTRKQVNQRTNSRSERNHHAGSTASIIAVGVSCVGASWMLHVATLVHQCFFLIGSESHQAVAVCLMLAPRHNVYRL